MSSPRIIAKAPRIQIASTRITRTLQLVLLAVVAPLALLRANELPRLPSDLDPRAQTYAEQQKLPYLAEPYVSNAPEDLGDGLPVGTLTGPGTEKAIKALLNDDKAGKYSNLDSILLWKDGRLIFEMYNRRGRVDGPHYAMPITKTLTSITLARAIPLGATVNDQ